MQASSLSWIRLVAEVISVVGTVWTLYLLFFREWIRNRQVALYLKFVCLYSLLSQAVTMTIYYQFESNAFLVRVAVFVYHFLLGFSVYGSLLFLKTVQSISPLKHYTIRITQIVLLLLFVISTILMLLWVLQGSGTFELSPTVYLMYSLSVTIFYTVITIVSSFVSIHILQCLTRFAALKTVKDLGPFRRQQVYIIVQLSNLWIYFSMFAIGWLFVQGELGSFMIETAAALSHLHVLAAAFEFKGIQECALPLGKKNPTPKIVLSAIQFVVATLFLFVCIRFHVDAWVIHHRTKIMLQSYLMLCFVAMVTVFTYQSLNSKPILLDQAKEMLLNVVIYATVIVWTRFTLLFGAVSLLTTYHLYYVIALATLTFLVSLVAECLRLAALVQNQPILEWQSMFYITSAAIQLWTFSLVIIALGVLLFVSVCVFLYQKGATDTKPLLKQLVYLGITFLLFLTVIWKLFDDNWFRPTRMKPILKVIVILCFLVQLGESIHLDIDLQMYLNGHELSATKLGSIMVRVGGWAVSAVVFMIEMCQASFLGLFQSITLIPSLWINIIRGLLTILFLVNTAAFGMTIISGYTYYYLCVGSLAVFLAVCIIVDNGTAIILLRSIYRFQKESPRAAKEQESLKMQVRYLIFMVLLDIVIFSIWLSGMLSYDSLEVRAWYCMTVTLVSFHPMSLTLMFKTMQGCSLRTPKAQLALQVSQKNQVSTTVLT
ncbi:hypothetical protein EDD86DRAFT_278508 [Gorgonomyces haynaldii]|nr:hypothetical protein EDD86DRAFT_278508 [Gorgonomyces haynaldii]